MKHFFILLLLSFIACGKKEPEIGQIKVNAAFCKSNKDFFYFHSHVKLFKRGEKVTEIKLKVKYPPVYNLEYSEYYFEYKTIFNKKNIVEFEVNEHKCKEIKLCFDYLDYKSNTNVLLLDELKNGENLSINYESKGCFGAYSIDEITISKSKNKINAEYKGIKYVLTNTQIQLLKEFEIELRSNHRDGCTTLDSYTIFNEREAYTMTDGSCQWRGFSNLISLLKLKK